MEWKKFRDKIDNKLAFDKHVDTFETIKKQMQPLEELCKNNFIKTLLQVLSCKLCKISTNTFFTEHLWATTSEKNCN